jgi:hypothetical protein
MWSGMIWLIVFAMASQDSIKHEASLIVIGMLGIPFTLIGIIKSIVNKYQIWWHHS